MMRNPFNEMNGKPKLGLIFLQKLLRVRDKFWSIPGVPDTQEILFRDFCLQQKLIQRYWEENPLKGGECWGAERGVGTMSKLSILAYTAKLLF